MKDDTPGFYCWHCNTPFRGMIWSLDRAHERTDFASPLPEVEIIDSSSVACFCSRECLDKEVPSVMAQEQVPIPAIEPDIGPIEQCAICRGPADMTEFHLAYSMSQCKETPTIVMEPLWYDSLAVVCSRCRPVLGAAAWSETRVETKESELLAPQDRMS